MRVRRTAAFMSPEDERKNGFIAYGMVTGMIAMLAIVYPLTWLFGSPDFWIVVLGLGCGSAAGYAVYRLSVRCPVCRSADCDPTCRICGHVRDEKHARYRGKTLLCTCIAARPDVHDGRPGHPVANDDGAGGSVSSGGLAD